MKNYNIASNPDTWPITINNKQAINSIAWRAILNISAKGARKIDNLMKKFVAIFRRRRNLWKFVRILKFSTICLRVGSILPSVKKSRKPRHFNRDSRPRPRPKKPETFRDSGLGTRDRESRETLPATVAQTVSSVHTFSKYVQCTVYRFDGLSDVASTTCATRRLSDKSMMYNVMYTEQHIDYF